MKRPRVQRKRFSCNETAFGATKPLPVQRIGVNPHLLRLFDKPKTDCAFSVSNQRAPSCSVEKPVGRRFVVTRFSGFGGEKPAEAGYYEPAGRVFYKAGRNSIVPLAV